MENEQVEQVTTRSVGIRYGLFLALIGIAYFVIMNVAGVDMTEGIGRWGSTIFYIALIFLAHKNYKENGNGFMSYGEGMGITFWLSLLSSVIGSIFTWIYVKYIDTEFIKMILQKQEEAMVAKGLPQDQIDMGLKMAAKFTTPEMMLIFGIIFGVIIIMIIGLLVTIFTQKKNPEMPV
jgi:Protein of unknown function (DUF4199)